MGLKEEFSKKTVFIDTTPLIYFIDGHSQSQDQLMKVLQANEKGEIHFQTLTLTLLEVLVQPFRHHRHDLVEVRGRNTNSITIENEDYS
jgi:predicted nucleic acid-binding protein